MLQRVYLDTTVPSAYIDSRAAERQRLTQEFWNERLGDYDPVTALVLSEIRKTPSAAKRKRLRRLVQSLTVLKAAPEAETLADEYIARGVLREKSRDDALHVAIAVTNQVPLLASWNFKHLVKLQVRREINLINAITGYGPIEIVTPPEL